MSKYKRTLDHSVTQAATTNKKQKREKWRPKLFQTLMNILTIFPTEMIVMIDEYSTVRTLLMGKNEQYTRIGMLDDYDYELLENIDPLIPFDSGTLLTLSPQGKVMVSCGAHHPQIELDIQQQTDQCTKEKDLIFEYLINVRPPLSFKSTSAQNKRFKMVLDETRIFVFDASTQQLIRMVHVPKMIECGSGCVLMENSELLFVQTQCMEFTLYDVKKDQFRAYPCHIGYFPVTIDSHLHYLYSGGKNRFAFVFSQCESVMLGGWESGRPDCTVVLRLVHMKSDSKLCFIHDQEFWLWSHKYNEFSQGYIPDFCPSGTHISLISHKLKNVPILLSALQALLVHGPNRLATLVYPSRFFI